MTDFDTAALQPQPTEMGSRTRSGKPNPFLNWLRTSYDNRQAYEIVVPNEAAAYHRGLARSAAQRLAIGCELQSIDLDDGRVLIKYFARPKNERKSSKKVEAAEQSEETTEQPA